jgi:putative hydrolase of the HAD superfamily
MSALQAVLFDLDNTLTHRDLSIASYAGRFAQDFDARLVDSDAATIAALIIERDNGGYGVKGSIFPTVRDDVAAALAARLRWRVGPVHDELVAHWFAHFPTHSIEMPGASALLDRLAGAGFALGIVSNGAEASRRELVRRLGFDSRVRTLVSSERAGMRKPDVRIFELAAREVGVAPQRCWFVGDHPVNDIAGARAAGMRPVWLRGFHAAADGDPPAPTIGSLAELESLVGAFTNA